MSICLVHQKQRALDFLEEIAPGTGQYKCSFGNECKTGGPSTATGLAPLPGLQGFAGLQGLQALPATVADINVTCFVHGKTRKSSVCTQVC